MKANTQGEGSSERQSALGVIILWESVNPIRAGEGVQEPESQALGALEVGAGGVRATQIGPSSDHP